MSLTPELTLGFAWQTVALVDNFTVIKLIRHLTPLIMLIYTTTIANTTNFDFKKRAQWVAAALAKRFNYAVVYLMVHKITQNALNSPNERNKLTYCVTMCEQ